MTVELKNVTFDTRDEYQRKIVAEKIIVLLSSGISVSPLVINGGWGTGKTEFCFKLIHLVNERAIGYTPIYINAFSADHADEPLMTLLAAVLNALPVETHKTLIQKALPAIRFVLKASLKAGVGWVLRQDAGKVADDFDKDIESASEEAINKSIESLLVDHIKAEQSIATLQHALMELTKSQHIILFVDELDRCRPNFAISMLESIKHIFGVTGVQIVLITNVDQLRTSLSHCYGMDRNSAKRYLDKFIGFSFSLPQTAKNHSGEILVTSKLHFRGLILIDPHLKDTWLQIESVLGFLGDLIELSNLSLREVETLIKHFQIYHIVTGGKGLDKNYQEGYQLLRSFGVFLYCAHPALIVDKTLDSFDVVEALKETKALYVPQNQSHYQPTIMQLLSMLIVFENNLFKDQLDSLDTDKLEEWKRWSYSLFRHGRLSGKVNKYILDACATLRLENL